MIVRPRRSVLYMPGSNARAIEKARSLPVDAVILDLEDSVAPEGKPGARAQVSDAVAARVFGPREVVVRINGLDTPWSLGERNAVSEATAAISSTACTTTSPMRRVSRKSATRRDRWDSTARP